MEGYEGNLVIPTPPPPLPQPPSSLKASGGEFGWGGTSAIGKRRCPKGSSKRTEISC